MPKYVHPRQDIGLSQQQLADYLQISRGHVAMFESGSRSLPAKQLLLLAALYKAAATTKSKEKNPGTAANKQLSSYTKKWSKHLLALQYRLKQLQKKQEQIQQEHERQELLLHTLQHLEENSSSPSDDSNRNTWISLTKSKSLKKINGNELTNMQMLDLRIRALEWEIAEVNKITDSL